MNTVRMMGSLAALCAMAGAASVPAAEYVDPAEGFIASKSREDVRRELVAAQADGTAASCKIDGIDNPGLCGPSAGRARLARETGSDTSDTLRMEPPGNMSGSSQAPASGR